MQPRIEVILARPSLPDNVQTALRRLNANTTVLPPGAQRADDPDARIIVAAPSNQPSTQALLESCCHRPCPTLVLTDQPHNHDLPPNTGPMPLSFANGISADELAGRLSAMCAFHDSARQYEQEMSTLRTREAKAAGVARQLREQLQLAASIQQDLLPDQHTATSDHLTVRAVYRPAGTVSGDVYDLSPLDDRHIALALLDATGHGMAAALLSAYVQHALIAQEIQDAANQIPQPDQVLARLNEKLLKADFTNCQFITGIFATYDQLTGRLAFARGAAPYPILLAKNRPPRLLKTAGPLIGAFPDQHFEPADITLQKADAVLFYTDGLDALLTHEGGRRIADDITQTTWFRSLRTSRLDAHLEAVEARLDFTPPDAWPCDDMTIVAIHNTG